MEIDVLFWDSPELRTPGAHADQLHKHCAEQGHLGRDYFCRECVRFFLRRYHQHNAQLLKMLSDERLKHREEANTFSARLLELEAFIKGERGEATPH